MRVELVAIRETAILCPECDALWVDTQELRRGQFHDYGTFMMAHGRASPENSSELVVRGYLLDDFEGQNVITAYMVIP